ncbi:hypothetical protein HDV00_007918 [Rhizophlyctis rosea]|nr:hypothetical protein HDV00_007918 [Rhizophlyctis rosea]
MFNSINSMDKNPYSSGKSQGDGPLIDALGGVQPEPAKTGTVDKLTNAMGVDHATERRNEQQKSGVIDKAARALGVDNETANRQEQTKSGVIDKAAQMMGVMYEGDERH